MYCSVNYIINTHANITQTNKLQRNYVQNLSLAGKSLQHTKNIVFFRVLMRFFLSFVQYIGPFRVPKISIYTITPKFI